MHETLKRVANFKFDPSLLMANKPSALYHRFNGDSKFNKLKSCDPIYVTYQHSTGQTLEPIQLVTNLLIQGQSHS